jgi:hypothetical protein
MQGDYFGTYLYSLAILVPLSLGFGLLTLIRYLAGRSVWKWLKGAIAVGGAVILLIFLILAGNSMEDRLENHAVRSYVARAVPILDQIKSRTGSYPSRLPAVLGEPPALLKDYGDYSSDGKSYRFEYVDEPAGWAGGNGYLGFESSDKRWKYDR